MSDTKRQVSITIDNATANALSASDVPKNGSPALSGASTIAVAKSEGYGAESTSQAVQGTLTLTSTATGQAVDALTIVYEASSHSDDTSITVTHGNAFKKVTRSSDDHDHTLDDHYTVYDALPQDQTGTMVLSVGSDCGTLAQTYSFIFHDMVDFMFDSTVRSQDAIAEIATAAAKTIADSMTDPAVTIHYADFSGGQIASLVAMWTEYWTVGSACPAPDAKLIDAFKSFIQLTDAPPVLWIPQLAFKQLMDPDTQQPADGDTGAAQFELLGYKSLDFFTTTKNADGTSTTGWNSDAVDGFLTLLASGAHLVAISAAQDNGGTYAANYDFYSYFKKGSVNLYHHEDQGSSHYVDGAPEYNSSGSYYLDISGEDTPTNVTYLTDAPDSSASTRAPISAMVAFMTGKTSQFADTGTGGYNPFMQMEGWPAHGNFIDGGNPFTGGGRHHEDYVAYNATLWNISTYGCSPYSEKRATTAFLAPPGWTPQITETTGMMPYVGAYAAGAGKARPWLNTYLFTLPTDGVAPYDPTAYPYET